MTLFTAANPGIPSGGFVGESKSAILSSLGRVPDFLLLSGEVPADVRIASVNEFMMARKLTYPIVLKPDVGERGTGVTIARNDEDMHSYLKTSVGDMIVQKYIAGLEFGIFYYRYPGQSKGRIFSITEKHFPTVVGDGASSITDLVLRDERAVCLADLYLARLKRPCGRRAGCRRIDYAGRTGVALPWVRLLEWRESADSNAHSRRRRDGPIAPRILFRPFRRTVAIH